MHMLDMPGQAVLCHALIPFALAKEQSVFMTWPHLVPYAQARKQLLATIEAKRAEAIAAIKPSSVRRCRSTHQLYRHP